MVIAGKEEKETENKFVGGRNRWTYDSFINWVRAAGVGRAGTGLEVCTFEVCTCLLHTLLSEHSFAPWLHKLPLPMCARPVYRSSGGPTSLSSCTSRCAAAAVNLLHDGLCATLAPCMSSDPLMASCERASGPAAARRLQCKPLHPRFQPLPQHPLPPQPVPSPYE